MIGVVGEVVTRGGDVEDTRLEFPRVHRYGDDARVGEATDDSEELEENVPNADVFRCFWNRATSQVENLDEISANLHHVADRGED